MNKKLALCVGLNYPGTSSELGGCVNDANDWSDLLLREGYEVKTLIEPLKEGILLALRDNISKVGFADRFVFTYSGHGSWQPDTSGDEPDRRDEGLCPSDFRTAGLLVDDELDAAFSSRKFGSSILMLSDSCFSGSVSKFFDVKGQGKARFMPPSLVAGNRALEPQDFTYPARASVQVPSVTSLISGCTDAEYSYDANFNGRGNGAFTNVALKTYVPGMSLNNWFIEIRKFLPVDWYPQSPQLTTSAYRKYGRAL